MISFTTDESFYSLPDQHKLYTKTWKPSGSPKALLLFVHGFSDHTNRFTDFFALLASRSIQVHGFDQRGWGRSVTSKAQRGLTGPTSTVMKDITSMLEPLVALSQKEKVPLFLMGHSMGGAEILYYAATGPEKVRKHIRGYVASAPYIRLHPASQPSRALVISGRFAMKLLPNWQMVQKLRKEHISRDPAIGQSWEEDELCHDTGTLEGMGGMIDRGEQLEKGTVVVKEGSVLVMHGSGDLITHHDTSKMVLEAMPVEDKTMKSYDGWYHVLHGEPGDDKTKYTNDIADWILARLDLPSVRNDDDSKSKL